MYDLARLLKKRKVLSVALSFVLILLLVVTAIPGTFLTISAINPIRIVNGYEESDIEYIKSNDVIKRKIKDSIETKSFGQFFDGVTLLDDENSVKSRALKITSVCNEDYKWPTAIRIYDQNDADYSFFRPKANTVYKISICYKVVAAPDRNVQFVVRRVDQYNNMSMDNYAENTYAVKIGDAYIGTDVERNVWRKAEGTFETTSDAGIFLAVTTTQKTGTTARWNTSGLEMYIDEIIIDEITDMVCHNYGNNGTDDEKLPVASTTTIGQLSKPTREGYSFEGFYSDKNLTKKCNDADLAASFAELWVKWEEKVAPINNNYDDLQTYTNGDSGWWNTAYVKRGGLTIGNCGVKYVETSDINGNPTKALNICAAGNKNYDWPTHISVYDSNSTSSQLFKTVSGKKYFISLKYKVNSWDYNVTNSIELVLREGNVIKNKGGKTVADLTAKKPITGSTETNSWIELTGSFTAESENNLILTATTNWAGPAESFSGIKTDIDVDDIVIEEAAEIICHKYDGIADYPITVGMSTVFSQLTVSPRPGFRFDGFWLNEEMTQKVDGNSYVAETSEIWAKWIEIGDPVVNNYDDGANYTTGTWWTWHQNYLKRDNLTLGSYGVTYGNTADSNGDPTLAAKFTCANQFNFKSPTSLAIYDSNSTTSRLFVTVPGTKYFFQFKYKLENWEENNKNAVEFVLLKGDFAKNKKGTQVVKLTGNTPLMSTDEKDKWVTITSYFTADGSDNIWIVPRTDSSSSDITDWGVNVNIWADDIIVDETVTLICNNYDGVNKKNIEIRKSTTFADLERPERDGYEFKGFYLDSAFAESVASTALASSVSEVWARWEERTTDEPIINDYEDGANYQIGDYGYYNNKYVKRNGLIIGKSGVTIGQTTDENGTLTKALKLAAASQFNYDYPTAIGIYDQRSKTSKLFKTTAGELYTIRLKYRVEEWNVPEWNSVDLILRQGNVDKAGGGRQLVNLTSSTPVSASTEKGKWITLWGVFEAKSDDVLWLTASTNSSTSASVSWAVQLGIYIDDIKIEKYSGSEKPDSEGKVGEPWSGQIAMAFAGGNGTEDNPYIIETPEQLAKLCNSLSTTPKKHYRLGADIIINDTSYNGWQEDARNWFTGYYAFAGHFDGAGHTISGLYYKGDALYAGLFPVLAENSVVENVGIINSEIANSLTGKGETYAGAITGRIADWFVSNPGANRPIIRQCFADTTVSVTAKYAGGLIGGVPAPFEIEDSYFTGSISYLMAGGGLMATTWANKDEMETKITNCYVATEGRDHISAGFGLKRSTIKNVYVDGPTDIGKNIVRYALLFFKGDVAKEKLKGFDYEKVWLIVEDGTPTLRIFGNRANDYTCKRESAETEITFISNGGSECDSVHGIANYSELVLPTPTRYGYKFAGWYHYQSLEVPCTIKTYPDYNIVLYAAWDEIGFTQDFESRMEQGCDYNASVSIFRPGVMGYNTKYVYNNLKSLHAAANNSEAPLFLVSYKNKLEVGKEYEMIFRIFSNTENPFGDIELLHSDYPDVRAPANGFQKLLSVNGIKSGEWLEFKVSFTANNPYILIKTPLNTDMYFDDIQLVYTGKDGKTGKFTLIDNSKQKPVVPAYRENTDTVQENADDNDYRQDAAKKKRYKKIIKYITTEDDFAILWVIAGGGAALLIVSGIVTFLLIRKKHRK